MISDRFGKDVDSQNCDLNINGERVLNCCKIIVKQVGTFGCCIDQMLTLSFTPAIKLQW